MSFSFYYYQFQILEGNKNTYTSVIQELTPPILASKIRFIPFSIHPRTICMRVEVYGCYYNGKLSIRGWWCGAAAIRPQEFKFNRQKLKSSEWLKASGNIQAY